jgi:hypothetical protein
MIERMFDVGFARHRVDLADAAGAGSDGSVDLLRACARELARAQAELLAAMWDVAAASSGPLEAGLDASGLDASGLDEFAADEVRAALVWTRRAADAQVTLAWQMRVRLPMVWDALWAGEIDLPRARVIVDGVAHLDDATARRVATEMLLDAGGRTTGQLRARLRRLIIEVAPEAEAERCRLGVDQRRVVVDANPDGTANLCGWDLAADRATAAMAHVNRLARAAKTATDGRTMDQVRADVFLDLLAGRQAADPSTGPSAGPSAHRSNVDIRVDLDTLMGLSEAPGEIPGWGPVIADVARKVAEANSGGRWRFTVVGDDHHIVANGITRRRPLADQRRYAESVNPTCVFPGCRMPATQSDVDHTRPWAHGGPTQTDNLAPLCRHDHRLKDEGGWALARQADGTYVWTSRLGHTYETQPQAP